MTRLSVALVGAGHIAAAHLAGWRRAGGCKVEGLLDVDPEAARARAARFGVPRVFADLEEACAAADVVDVCTPPHTHPSIAAQAADAGRHVLVEKPVVTSIADWEALRPRFEGEGPRLGVVHNLKFTRAVMQAGRWLADGRIGRLLRLRHDFLTHPSADRMLAGPHWSHDLPGGRWFETLPHALYLIHELAGPLELAAVAALRTPSKPAGVAADEVELLLAGPGCLATISYSANCPANRRTLRLVGELGTIHVDLLADAVHIERRSDGRTARALGPAPASMARLGARFLPDRLEYLTDRVRGVTPHGRLIAAFAGHLRGEGEHPTPLAEVDYVVRRCDEIGRRIDAVAGDDRAAD